MKWAARAPANIALVKYMGKCDARLNLPANASLSMTLDSLCTVVELREAAATRWVAAAPSASVSGRELRVPALDAAGAAKFEKHLARVISEAPGILSQFGLRMRAVGEVEIRSANTFPAASGIASSASAFAALTLAGAQACAADLDAFAAAWEGRPEFRRAWARVARQGSGSACRSLEGPWVRWVDTDAAAVSSRLPAYVDLVLLVASGKKAVSSTDAHAAVVASPLWAGRVERANARVAELSAALAAGDASVVAQVAWTELWEMHSLFHTSPQPFTYWLPLSLEILQWLKPLVEGPGAPVVTMDAGPNVHLLVPATDAAQWRARVAERFPGLLVLEDRAGGGAATAVS